MSWSGGAGSESGCLEVISIRPDGYCPVPISAKDAGLHSLQPLDDIRVGKPKDVFASHS